MNAPTILLNGEALPPSSRGSSSLDQEREGHTARDGSCQPHNVAVAWVWRSGKGAHGGMRHTLGILCLLTTVVLWTTSNFLASDIFADDTYSKPYLVTYINTSFFILPLIPLSIIHLYRNPSSIRLLKAILAPSTSYAPLSQHDSPELPIELKASKLTLPETSRLALSFCFLWFTANYFVSACLSYTTVGSATILTSTSSIWTLFFGALLRTEPFTLRKLVGALACLAGVALTAGVDLSGRSNENRGKFPEKTVGELGLGNAMALFSALLYGLYAVLMKKRIGDETRVNMVVFFGLVGVWNVVLLWPGLFVLHWLGIEPWELPPSDRVTAILSINGLVSLISDICWGLAMLLTTPLLVTIGLSLTIPLSLVGQVFLNAQTSSATYWLGAIVVLLSFIFVNHEESKELPVEEPAVSIPAAESIAINAT